MILIFLKTPLQKNEEREKHCDQSAAELPFLSFETHVISSGEAGVNNYFKKSLISLKHRERESARASNESRKKN